MDVRNHYHRFALALAPHAAAVANYCDHSEHNEVVYTSWVTNAAEALRELSVSCARERDLDVIELYATRLGAIEERNVLCRVSSFDGVASAQSAITWRDLQLVQVEHDRAYHPDVVGTPKVEQLRHYALHLAKIVGAFATPDDEDDLLARRLPDSLLFGIKLSTVMGQKLADEELPRIRTSIPSTSSFIR